MASISSITTGLILLFNNCFSESKLISQMVRYVDACSGLSPTSKF